MEIIKEGLATIRVQTKKIVDSKMPVFYNPDMKLNRDLSIYILRELAEDGWKIGLPLAGSGIRGLRIKLEVNKDLRVFVNDYKKEFAEDMMKRADENKAELEIYNEDANLFLEKNKFDYVDIDPFGTPNPFLDSGVRSLKNNGVLAVTATDTGALCGSFTKACQRKYWATPLRDELMHETGIRILIRKIQMMGGQHDVALIPIYSISTLHYMKVFFRVKKGKQVVDLLMKKHEMRGKAGPLWTGDLWDLELADKVALHGDDKILRLISEEAKQDGEYIEIHKMSKRHNLKSIPKFEKILGLINGSRTHFSDVMIKTKVKEKELVEIIRQLS